ncbi:MAG TPA: SET domain-containing histone-lysine N-methyltransferase [Hyalangium sp.]|nr:SET domain-containing histone-lysine N-methyltransferase [Hyalangium sp.]
MAALLRWLEEGGAHVSKVHAVSLGGGERGLRALEDIAPEETLLRIPSRYVLTVEEARSSSIGRLLEVHTLAEEERVYLAAFLLQERELGERSFWKPFLDSLPKSFPCHPFFYDERELALLQGSVAPGLVRSTREGLKAEHALLCKHVPGFERFTLDAFVWAHFAVVTRTFSVLRSGTEVACLVPFADMINDGRPWDVQWEIPEGGTHFELKSKGVVASGQELRTSYGLKGNLQLLFQYGFAHEENPYDEVMTFLSLPLEDPLAADKQQLLGLTEPFELLSYNLTLTDDAGLMDEMFSFLRVACADAEELAALIATPHARSRAQSPLSARNEQKAIDAFVTLCEEQLADYETPLAEDERMLREEQLSTNARNCILVRRGEKRILEAYAARARSRRAS